MWCPWDQFCTFYGFRFRFGNRFKKDNPREGLISKYILLYTSSYLEVSADPKKQTNMEETDFSHHMLYLNDSQWSNDHGWILKVEPYFVLFIL